MGRIAEEEADDHEADDISQYFANPGEDDAGHDAEDETAGGQNFDGRQARRIGNDDEQDGDAHGRIAEGSNVGGDSRHVAVPGQSDQGPVEAGDEELDGGK